MTPDAGRENAAPASGEGAGANSWADTVAAEIATATIARTEAFFTMLTWAISLEFMEILTINRKKQAESNVNKWVSSNLCEKSEGKNGGIYRGGNMEEKGNNKVTARITLQIGHPTFI